MTSFRSRLLACVFLASAVAAWAQSPTERAEALLDKGEFLAAERLIESLALAKKPDPVAVWELSRVRTGQHQTEHGIKLAEKAIKLDPKQGRFHAQLGAAIAAHLSEVTRLDQFTWANRMRKAYEKALELDPNNVVALTGLSRYHWSTPPARGGDMAKARQLAEHLRKIDRFKGEMELGAIAGRTADFKTALTHFEAAAQADPTNAEAQVSCGHVLLRLDRRREARECYENAVRIAPRSELARNALEAFEFAEKKAADAKR